MTDGLPLGWTVTRLESLVGPDGLMTDGDWVESKDQDPNGEVRLIQLADVGDGAFLDKSSRFLTQAKAKELNCTFLICRDVLISRLGQPLGKSCLFPGVGQPCVTVVDVHIVRPASDDVNRAWLVHLINSASVRAIIESQSSGTTRKRITGQKLKDLQVRVPPSPEQGRIANKIDELFSRIDGGERALESAATLVKRYHQSVLKAAVTGELTREWRARNKERLESGETLLARILRSRREAWETTELNKMKAKGIAPTNDKWRQKYNEPRRLDSSTLPELPHGWVWVSLATICAPERNALKAGPFGSSLRKSDYSKSGYKVYGQEQVIAGKWSIGDYFIDANKYRQLESCKVQPSDVLISLVGTIGRVLVLPEESAPGIINPRLIKVSLNHDAYDPTFFKTYFESAFLKSLYSLEAHGATMDVLNMSILERLPFPMCGLDEQRRITAYCADAFDRIARISSSCFLEGRRSAALRRTILKLAFNGDLVPQDPSDHPASSILGRIATKCTAESAGVKRSRKKKSTA